jgi:hypothetical protein
LATDHASGVLCHWSSQRSASLRSALFSSLYSALIAATTCAAAAIVLLSLRLAERPGACVSAGVAVRGGACVSAR